MKIYGDSSLATEIIDVLQQWDHAVTTLDVDYAMTLCTSDLCCFDLSSEINSLDAYRQKWEIERPFLLEGVDIQRHDISMHISADQAFVHGYFKLIPLNSEIQHMVYWSRFTVCLQKKPHGWKLVHQHMSVPVDLQTQAMLELQIHA